MKCDWKVRWSMAGLVVLGFAIAAVAGEGWTTTYNEAWQRLKDGNARYTSGKTTTYNTTATRRQELTTGQHPFAVVLSCADSRVPPEIIFNQGLGDLFVVRVAGNVCEPYSLGSIDYAVDHLHAPLIVVLGHENCGAVTAAMNNTYNKTTGAKASTTNKTTTNKTTANNLDALLNQVYLGKQQNTNTEKALTQGVENNVRYQANELLRRSQTIRNGVGANKVKVVGGVYDLSTGKVRWLDLQ